MRYRNLNDNCPNWKLRAATNITHLIPILFLFLTSCMYSNDDLSYVEKEEAKAPELEVVELSLQKDTIFLTYYQDIKFNFSAGDHDVVQVGILIDGEEKYSSSNANGTFSILAGDIDEGIHKLSFSVITNSNTGSIADLLGYEGFQFISNEWTLVCVKNDRMANHTEKTIENGFLKLSWEAHSKVNFKRYRIAKSHNSYSAAYKEYYTTNHYFTDSAYVGEKAHYDVYTEYYSSDGYYFQWAEFDIENTLPSIKIKSTDDGQFEVNWTNNDFFAAVKNYRLINLVTPADTVTMQESTPSENNSFIIPDGIFGNDITYWLVVVPEYPEAPFDNDAVYYHSTKFDGLIGEKTFSFDQLSAINQQELLVRRGNYIYRQSAEQNETLDSLTYSWENCGVSYGGFSLSPQRKYFTTSESCNKKLVLMDPNNLKDYQSYPIAHVLVDGMSFNSMPVSDNGIVVAKDYERISIYNVLNDQIIATLANNSSIYGIGISSNGDYFHVETSELCFYKVEEDSIREIWKSPPAYNYIYSVLAYDSENPENIILYDGETLYHKNLSDFSTTKALTLNENRIISLDLPTRRLLSYTNGYLSVYSIDTGERIFRFQADQRVGETQHHCTLAINTIYLDDGICFQLPNNE